MAKRRKRPAADGRARTGADEKIARLLALMLVNGVKKKTDAVPMLRRAGFEISEVANMLGMTENHVKVADHHGRKKAG